MIEKEIIWKHIKEHAGAEFHTVRGHSFTYAIRGDCFIPSRTNYLIGKQEFTKALNLCPLTKVSDIGNVVRGGSYVFAVLTDKRIRQHYY